MTRKVRIAIIGAGNIGNLHLNEAASIEAARLVAVCDVDRARADAAAEKAGARAYYDHVAALEKSGAEAVIIATPHYFHPEIAAAAFARGISALSEKPIAVYVNDAKRMIDAYEKARTRFPALVFSAMFQQRTLGMWMTLKEIIASGRLGKIVRATWIVTDWFRSQAYYDSGGWRATWKGEGGGVLLNQCPHNLDLYQYFFGMPERVTAFASFGKYHDIEVEDEVTAYFEHSGGMVGHFITTTGEAPGTNRLEVVGENGKLVCEDGKILFWRNARSMLAHIREAKTAWEPLACEKTEVPVAGPASGGHRAVIEDFCGAVAGSQTPYIDGREGIRMVELDNAIRMSALEKRSIGLPMDSDAYEERLRSLAATSRYLKREGGFESDAAGFESSFGGGKA
jgi:predicted dehydrogenase